MQDSNKSSNFAPANKQWSLRLSVRTRDFHSLKSSSVKRIRQDKKKALHNKYYAKTMRNAVRKLRNMTDKEEAAKLYPTVQKLLDKLAKINVIHENKAANLKSGLTQHIAKLA